jgi:hypothetical protein
VCGVDDAGIKLAYHIEQARSRLIEIPSTDIPRIGEQRLLNRAAIRPFDREPKVVPGEEHIRGNPADRQADMISREFNRGWHWFITVTGGHK